MNIEQHTPNHVIFWGIYRWHHIVGSDVDGATEGAVTAQLLKEHIGPCQFYQTDRVIQTMYRLHGEGFLEKATLNEKVIGYTITESGAAYLVGALGKPKHFQH
jgi:hypothetical protein